MVSSRTRLVVVAVVGLAILQVAFEDLLVFSAVTGQGQVGPPVVLIGVPLLIATVLILLTIGVAIRHDDTLR